MKPDRLPHYTAHLSALRVNRPICTACGSDDLCEMRLCTPSHTGWRECVDCGCKLPHPSDCTICKTALNYPAAYASSQSSAQSSDQRAFGQSRHPRWADTVSDPTRDNDEVHGDPHAGVKVTVISLLAFAALIGLSWLLSHSR